MKFTETKLKGLYLITLEPKNDQRGAFTRIFCQKEFTEIGIKFDIVQASVSLTKKRGIIRGMHFQKKPCEEDKIIQCIKGKIYDVVIDLRKNSKTFGKWIAEELSGKNNKMILATKGFAHGFQTLSNNCEVLYFMSQFYSPEYSFGVRWDDPLFNIKWPIQNPLLSEKDRNWPLL